jgi:hypothetical protein
MVPKMTPIHAGRDQDPQQKYPGTVCGSLGNFLLKNTGRYRVTIKIWFP